MRGFFFWFCFVSFFMHVNTRPQPSKSPKYLGDVLEDGVLPSVWSSEMDFALQFVISLKNTRTGKDCTSNALENTSIKNWLIQWNRAEAGRGRQTACQSSRRNPGRPRAERLESGEESLTLSQLLSKTRRRPHPAAGRIERTRRRRTWNLFLACFAPLSAENKDTAWA